MEFLSVLGMVGESIYIKIGSLFGNISNVTFDMWDMMIAFFLTFGIILFYSRKRVVEGISYPPLANTSFGNAANQLRGNIWTSSTKIKREFFETSERSLKLDNFAQSKTFLSRLSIWRHLFKPKAEIFIEPLSLTKTLTMVAPMGGGKTVTLNALLAQDWYNRAIINEQKAGDFTSKWYNKRKDIILCPYDKRSHVWDILSESIPIIEFFIQNTINAAVGGKISFFSNDAIIRYTNIARLTIEKNTSKEKWSCFIEEFETMQKEIESNKQDSAKDVLSTMIQIIDMLKFMNHQIQSGRKTFTIKDFFAKQHQSKLFLMNIDEYEVQLKPLFAAFTACVSMVHASKEESDTDLTFYCLDEFLSLEMNFDAKKSYLQKLDQREDVYWSRCIIFQVTKRNLNY